MDEQAPSRGPRHILWWFGAFVLLGTILLVGPILTCRRCEEQGRIRIERISSSLEYDWTSYRCPDCYGLKRLGLMRWSQQRNP
jgi:hypothetical protein